MYLLTIHYINLNDENIKFCFLLELLCIKSKTKNLDFLVNSLDCHIPKVYPH